MATSEQIVSKYKDILFKTNIVLVPNANERYNVLNYIFDNWSCIKTTEQYSQFITEACKVRFDSIEVKTVIDLFFKAKENNMFEGSNATKFMIDQFRKELDEIKEIKLKDNEKGK